MNDLLDSENLGFCVVNDRSFRLSVTDGFDSLKGNSVLVGEVVYCDLGLASLAEQDIILKAELAQAIGESTRDFFCS